MSINISNAVAKISDISITIHLDRLGPRQKKSLERMVRTGVVRGGWSSFPAKVAEHILFEAGVAYIRVNNWSTEWKNVPLDPEHPLRKALIECDALSVMIDPRAETNNWQIRHGHPSNKERVHNHIDSPIYTYFEPAATKVFNLASCGYDIKIPATLDGMTFL